MRILIRNGRVIDPATNRDGKYDLLIEDNKIIEVSEKIDTDADKIINADNLWVMPGLIDMHVHLREPGFEHKETIETGSKSAARGGFTSICPMPNTNPPIDNEFMVEYIKVKAEREAIVNILPVGAITKGQLGEEMSNIGNMAAAGIVALSEDGKSVMNANLYKKAMIYSKNYNLPILAHCEEKSLAGKGVINAGSKALELGLSGISNDVEDIITIRDIILAESTGARLHLCHLSTEGAVRFLKEAKQRGVLVTAEVCPHHFALTVDDITGYDTNYKMNPPLRNRNDVDAILEALKSDIIDVIATDHAPHHEYEKNTTMDEAPFGIVGLETAVALTITELVDKGIITPMQMATKMSFNPAKILGINKGTLSEGSIADVVIIDPNFVGTVEPEKFASKSKNTPFKGRSIKGRVNYTFVSGIVVYDVANE
ncbi:MAG: dihydroorotase [Clostridiales bacterium]|jgi:dihydroorotase|nr:dihydroorotase [Clostridiales bacterium]